MKGTALYRFWMGVVFAAIICVGCFGKSPSSRFYMLSAIAPDTAVALPESPAHNAAVGIGPIKIADYLDRSKIVTRTSGNRLTLAEYDQWAGSFEDNLTHVLADNIGVLVPTERIYLYPWRTSLPIDYQVAFDIVRCDGRLGESVDLVVRWRLLGGGEKDVLAIKRTRIREAVNGADYDALVSAHNRALAVLSRQIAATIQAASREQAP
jgi:uncharacterized lipoprotein YmbA